jgi:hypothetical protein
MLILLSGGIFAISPPGPLDVTVASSPNFVDNKIYLPSQHLVYYPTNHAGGWPHGKLGEIFLANTTLL